MKKSKVTREPRTIKAKYDPFIGSPVAFSEDDGLYKILTEHTLAEYVFMGIHTAEISSRKKQYAILKSGEYSLKVIDYKQLVITTVTT